MTSVVLQGQFDPVTFSGTMGHNIALSSIINTHTDIHTHTYTFKVTDSCSTFYFMQFRNIIILITKTNIKYM